MGHIHADLMAQYAEDAKKHDKYDFALECMEEAGRSEPTIEDELNGVRRLIDAAIAAQTKQGDEE